MQGRRCQPGPKARRRPPPRWLDRGRPVSADKRLILRGCWRLIGQISLHPHVQVVLLPKPGDLRHHGGGVVGVQSLLISPAVDQQHSLRVLHGEEIGIPQVPCLCPDRIHDAADGHLLCEFPGSSAVARVIDIDSDCHRRILPVWFFQFYHRARVLSRRPSGPAAQSVSRKG